jgi:hypothetical protein
LVPGDDERKHRRRLVVWLVVTLCVLAELIGLGLVRAHGATALGAPIISAVGLPADPTTAPSATFFFTNDRTVVFSCTLDGGEPVSCGAGLLGSRSYPGPLEVGRHVFEVRAFAGGETSDPATYAWTVVGEPGESAPPSDDAGAKGSSGGTDDAGGTSDGTSSSQGSASARDDGAPFEISGDVGGLEPGIPKPILLRLHNPNENAISVTSITVEVAVESTPPGCASASNIVLAQAQGITGHDPVVVPGRSTVVLRPGRAPTITLRNRPWNQDACKGKSFELTYSGKAHS